MTFNDLNIIPPILKALEEKKYSTPTPIQEKAIPVALNQQDLLGCAQTGTGKTAAFAIPIIQRLSKVTRQEKHRPIRALILTPTRELAIQIDECFNHYAKYTHIKHSLVFGGVNQNSQVEKLKKGMDVLIATPGRLLDLMAQGFVNLDAIECFVLDEADKMLGMGFIHDIKRLLPKLPQKKQTLFFSATMPPEIIALSKSILHNPVKVEISPESSVVDTIDQYVYYVEKEEKRVLLISLVKQAKGDSILVFSRTKHGADRIARTLCRAGIDTEAIHSNKSQTARQRALNNFKSGKTRVMIATDIAARGLDINKLPFVINYDLPDMPETYIHRIGRTGRAGRTGTALTFCSQDEMKQLITIQKMLGFTIPAVS
ncbi:MAG: DEAD/DEAH box helicase [Bacteroidetes bacterium]|nr:DEAD/DEAH box helicase [Bacteroidota bacterium]MCL2302691.1 DEAD/DEAH box helicase [Lentimicrobiaceae bacterium]